jgi:pimeloyl-ACP methyl ester carboxylesterase
VVGILDALDLRAAHLVGMSMGGAIAQVVALDHPDRVRALTLISTSPSGGDPDLPTMPPEAAAVFGAAPKPDWSHRDSVIAYLEHMARASTGSARPFDADGFRALAGRVFDRTRNAESSQRNHHLVDGAARWRERLGELRLPVLVVHGTDDPVLPYQHGVALAREIPGARMLTLRGNGHELPRAVWDEVVRAILALG